MRRGSLLPPTRTELLVFSRRGTGRVTIIASWEHHFFLANRERFGAQFDLLRPLFRFLENDFSLEDAVERTLQLI